MTGTRNSRREALATIARVVFFLSLVVGVLLAAAAGWGLYEVRHQDNALGPDVPLVGNYVVVPMTEGWERTVFVDGPSLQAGRCVVTAPDGTTQVLEGFDTVGQPRLGKRALGKLEAQQGGDYRVECAGVEEAMVSGEFDPVRRRLLSIPGFSTLLLVFAILPMAVISLVTWRVARAR